MKSFNCSLSLLVALLLTVVAASLASSSSLDVSCPNASTPVVRNIISCGDCTPCSRSVYCNKTESCYFIDGGENSALCTQECGAGACVTTSNQCSPRCPSVKGPWQITTCAWCGSECGSEVAFSNRLERCYLNASECVAGSSEAECFSPRKAPGGCATDSECPSVVSGKPWTYSTCWWCTRKCDFKNYWCPGKMKCFAGESKSDCESVCGGPGTCESGEGGCSEKCPLPEAPNVEMGCSRCMSTCGSGRYFAYSNLVGYCSLDRSACVSNPYLGSAGAAVRCFDPSTSPSGCEDNKKCPVHVPFEPPQPTTCPYCLNYCSAVYCPPSNLCYRNFSAAEASCHDDAAAAGSLYPYPPTSRLTGGCDAGCPTSETLFTNISCRRCQLCPASVFFSRAGNFLTNEEWGHCWVSQAACVRAGEDCFSPHTAPAQCSTNLGSTGSTTCQRCAKMSYSFCNSTQECSVNALTCKSRHRPCYSNFGCLDVRSAQSTCCNLVTSELLCRAMPACGWQPAVLDVVDARPYCSSSNTDCTSLTCAGIGQDRARCLAAGCAWRESNTGYAAGGYCAPSQCFQFLLPGYLPITLTQTLLGVVKDVAVLVIVGLLGDYLAKVQVRVRKIRRKVFGHFKDEDDIPNHIDDPTMFARLGDAQLHRLCDCSFEEYVSRLARAIFVMDFGAAEEKKNSETLREERRLLLIDAVAVSLVSKNYWIHLPSLPWKAVDVQDEEQQQQEQQKSSPAAVAAAAAVDESSTNRRRVSSTSSTAAAQDIFSSRAGRPDQFFEGERVRLVHRKSHALPEEGERIKLGPELFASLPALQKEVAASLKSFASGLVFYSNSADKMKRIALNVNSFPSLVQLFFYLLSILILFFLTVVDVTVDNSATVRRLVQSCRANATADLASNETQTRAPGSSLTPHAMDLGTVETVAFFLVGFKFCSCSSAAATSILVFVKTFRAVFNLWRGKTRAELHRKFPSLAIRMPLLRLEASRPLQCLLLLYFSGTLFVFATVPLVLGPAELGWPCCILYAGCALFLLFLLFLRWFFEFDAPTVEEEEKNRVQQRPVQHEKENTAAVAAAEEEEEDTRGSSVSGATGTRGSKMRKAATPAASDEAAAELMTPRERTSSETEVSHDVTTAAAATAPFTFKSLRRQLAIFMVKEELPVVALTLALQFSFSYVVLLRYATLFGIFAPENVFGVDFDARSLQCTFQTAAGKFLNSWAVATSFLPFS